MKICSIDGCGGIAQKRGWCGMHYRRWTVHGDPAITKKRANGSGYLERGYIGRQTNGTKKFEHVEIAERVIGRPLPSGVVVHHANGIKSDNRNSNLVICPNRRYHNLLHARIDAMAICGNPDWRKCRYCQKYDDLKNLRVYKTKVSTAYWHRDCLNTYARTRKKAS